MKPGTVGYFLQMNRIRKWAVLLAVVAAMSACSNNATQTGNSSQAKTTPQTAPAQADAARGYADIVERLSPSVVTVQTDSGLGSGVVLRPDIVVTNEHVVGRQPDVAVVFADGVGTRGHVMATDTVTDLAVVRTDRKNLPVPEYRSELPRPGETALAIGSPLGFQNSVTAGVISGLHRDIPGSAAQSSSLVDLIQTDASISPGNSGGALLDASGRTVGISEAYIPPAAGAVSLGFAIPSATVLDVANQLITTGKATHPYLGISTSQVTAAIQQALGVNVDHGALVLGVDQGAPAAAAGLRPGDVIVEFAGKPVRTVEDLLGTLRQAQPGSQQPLVFVRGGQQQQVSVTVGSHSS
ncbi:S1C family serine protease [Mycobacterium sp.]|jgi:S1-C subfamily serine protease|uniref:S1C family serine protease n=1 Tax=Mycobacterium sp. TaxID=1785 RepID=UPI002D23B0B3|nr:trypsin-like peptidase domain-containing protein [Mycobacterium sp.]HZA08876.1 trypsin-like peptidase domain-containing protein [Mycobacterium sp.]